MDLTSLLSACSVFFPEAAITVILCVRTLSASIVSFLVVYRKNSCLAFSPSKGSQWLSASELKIPIFCEKHRVLKTDILIFRKKNLHINSRTFFDVFEGA